MAHVYLGVIIICLILAMKVVMDSLKIMSHIKLGIDSLQASTYKCKEDIVNAEKLGEEKAQEVAQKQQEMQELVEKEKDLNSEIKKLRGALEGGQKFKLDI